MIPVPKTSHSELKVSIRLKPNHLLKTLTSEFTHPSANLSLEELMEKLYTDIDYESFPVADLTADIHWIQLPAARWAPIRQKL